MKHSTPSLSSLISQYEAVCTDIDIAIIKRDLIAKQIARHLNGKTEPSGVDRLYARILTGK